MSEHPIITETINHLAIGVYHVITHQAMINFPLSKRSHPSPIVLLTLGYGTKTTYSHYFPMSIIGNIWHKILVPIFEDESVVTLSSIRREHVTDYIKSLETQIRINLMDQKYIPDTREQVIIQPLLGEPVTRVINPEGLDGSYQFIDYPVSPTYRKVD